MDKLETTQKVGEASTKAFDKMDNKEKKEGFNSLIDEVEGNNTIKWLKENWNLLNEEQKLKIYKRHSISLGTYFRYSLYTSYGIAEKTYNAAKNAMSKGDNHTGKYALLEEIPCRFLVQLGVLDKPKGLTDDKLKEDIKKDAKNFDIYLNICEKVCYLSGETRAVVPLIKVARYYTQWYKTEGTDTIIERLSKKKKDKIKEQTNRELSEAISDIKEEKKAA